MRILTGTLRGKPIAFTIGKSLRPTSDKVREALVNILRTKFEDAVVLDLFSGTGALGLEALSNGAKSVVFVEHHNNQFAQIHANIKAAGLTDETTQVLGLDAYKAMDGLGQPFDLIFADPPYAENHQEKLLENIVKKDLLKTDGLFILEAHKSAVPSTATPLTCISQKTYGDTQILIYRA